MKAYGGVGVYIITIVIATGYGLDDRGVGVRIPLESIMFFSPRLKHQLWGPPSLLSNGYRGLFSGVKRQGREVDHSPQTTAEVKNLAVYSYEFLEMLRP
jgi:hypothetical protein